MMKMTTTATTRRRKGGTSIMDCMLFVYLLSVPATY